jgi:large subunit ribosomal protein L5
VVLGLCFYSTAEAQRPQRKKDLLASYLEFIVLLTKPRKITQINIMAQQLKTKYQKEITPKLMEQFGYTNVLQVPKVIKITVNRGLGEAATNAKALESSLTEIAKITGQKPVVTRAKKAIAGFKIRAGMPVGVMVTLRGDRMYAFLDRFINLTLPRIRDFRGISPKSFDGRGNYSIGIREQLIFPEIEYDQIDQIRGMDISIITTADNDEAGRALLKEMGMPFRAS